VKFYSASKQSLSLKSGHTPQFAPLPPALANTRTRAWPSRAWTFKRVLRHAQSAARHRRKQPAVWRAACVLCFALSVASMDSMVMSTCCHAYAIYVHFPLQKYISKYNINKHVLWRSVELLSLGRRVLAGARLPPPSIATRPSGAPATTPPSPLRRRRRFGAAPRVPKAVLGGRAPAGSRGKMVTLEEAGDGEILGGSSSEPFSDDRASSNELLVLGRSTNFGKAGIGAGGRQRRQGKTWGGAVGLPHELLCTVKILNFS